MKPCPRCESPLEETHFGQIKIDGCNGCGGTWFDSAELSAISRTPGARGLVILEDRFQPHHAPLIRSETMNCPVCLIEMYAFEFKHTPGIELNACPQCRGIWADEGELQAIHNWLYGNQSSTPAPPPMAYANASPRQKARASTALLVSAPCPHCQQMNPQSSLLCWACGNNIKGFCSPFCPNCDIPMETEEHFQIHLETCKDCGGVWLDAGELDVIAQRPSEELARIEEKRGEFRAAVSVMWEREREMLCPSCHLPLEEQPSTETAGVRFDDCNRCGGVWVGGGKIRFVSNYYNRTLERRSLRMAGADRSS